MQRIQEASAILDKLRKDTPDFGDLDAIEDVAEGLDVDLTSLQTSIDWLADEIEALEIEHDLDLDGIQCELKSIIRDVEQIAPLVESTQQDAKAAVEYTDETATEAADLIEEVLEEARAEFFGYKIHA